MRAGAQDDNGPSQGYGRFMRALILLLLISLPAFTAAFPVERCVNIDQALEAPNARDWGPPITRDEIRWIAGQGFDTIRLPVRFSAHWDGRIDRGFLGRVDQVIGWAFDADLHVILDLHHFDALMTDPAAQGATFVAIWTALARHYAAYDDRLIFELLNEPNAALDTSMAMALYDQVYPVIRQTNPHRWIVIEGGDWANIATLDALRAPDNRTVLSFHYYDPYPFTHQQAPWLADAPPPARWGTGVEREAVILDMRRARAVAGSSPLLLGEFGVTTPTESRERVEWTKAVRVQAEFSGIAWCHWGLSGNFAIRDRDNGDWLPGMQDALFSRR